MRKHLQIATLLLTAHLTAVAQTPASRVFRAGNQWVEENTGTVTAGKVLRVKTSAGSIKVLGGDQSNITYVIRKRVRARSEEAARHEFALLKANTYTMGNAVVFRAECGESDGETDFELRVPSQTVLLRLDTESGSVTATNVAGQVEANTDGGVIQLDEIGGMVVAKSGAGNIEVGNTRSDVRLETDGGNIRVVSAGGNVSAVSGGGDLSIGSGRVMVLNTDGGSIRVNKCTGQLKAFSGGGNLDLNEISGAAQIETSSGAIRIGPLHGSVNAETGSGGIIADLAAARNAFSESRLEASMGNIVVYVPDDLGVTVHASVEACQGNTIRSDFPGLKITGSGQGWGTQEAYAEGNLNGGGPILHVHTISGNIEFKRKSKQ